ncbi:hypothetical protein LIA77_07618 [Sarocladium implicatum]|nr:hypothetical protein LIA77_07618 [Sarocladium implicatum]
MMYYWPPSYDTEAGHDRGWSVQLEAGPSVAAGLLSIAMWHDGCIREQGWVMETRETGERHGKSGRDDQFLVTDDIALGPESHVAMWK